LLRRAEEKMSWDDEKEERLRGGARPFLLGEGKGGGKSGVLSVTPIRHPRQAERQRRSAQIGDPEDWAINER
jgi:hypothetical protein